MMDERRKEPVIACHLTDRELAARLDELARALFSTAEQIEELPDGYAFCFEGSREQAARLTTFVLEERECCPFFHFDLQFAPYGGPIRLQLRGNAEIKAFTETMMNNG